jgi:hypothetical protein
MSYYRTSINDIMHPRGGPKGSPKVNEDLQYKSLEALEMLIEKVDDLYSRPVVKIDDIKDFIVQYIVPPQELQYPAAAAASSASSGARNASGQGKLSMDSSLSDWIPTLAISISIINILALLIVAVVIVIILLSRPASGKRG